MSRFWQSFIYGLIVTLAIMGPTFGFGVLWTIGTGGDAVKYAADCIVLSFVVLGFSTWGLYELQGLFDRANRPRSEDRDRDNRDGDIRNGTNLNPPVEGDKANDKTDSK